MGELSLFSPRSPDECAERLVAKVPRPQNSQQDGTVVGTVKPRSFSVWVRHWFGTWLPTTALGHLVAVRGGTRVDVRVGLQRNGIAMWLLGMAVWITLAVTEWSNNRVTPVFWLIMSVVQLVATRRRAKRDESRLIAFLGATLEARIVEPRVRVAGQGAYRVAEEDPLLEVEEAGRPDSPMATDPRDGSAFRGR